MRRLPWQARRVGGIAVTFACFVFVSAVLCPTVRYNIAAQLYGSEEGGPAICKQHGRCWICCLLLPFFGAAVSRAGKRSQKLERIFWIFRCHNACYVRRTQWIRQVGDIVIDSFNNKSRDIYHI